MERKIRNPLGTIGLIGAMTSALGIAAFVVGFGDILFSTPELTNVFFSFVTTFFLGIALMAPGWRRKRKLARLRAKGVAYDAADIIHKPVPWLFRTMGYVKVKAHVVYTDDKGVTHTTKDCPYAIGSLFGAIRMDSLEFFATVYVNPRDPQDYAVDFRAKVRQPGGSYYDKFGS